MAKSISIDPQKWLNDIMNYFSHLPQDMIIAWSAAFVGLVLLIVGVMII